MLFEKWKRHLEESDLDKKTICLCNSWWIFQLQFQEILINENLKGIMICVRTVVLRWTVHKTASNVSNAVKWKCWTGQCQRSMSLTRDCRLHQNDATPLLLTCMLMLSAWELLAAGVCTSAAKLRHCLPFFVNVILTTAFLVALFWFIFCGVTAL